MILDKLELFAFTTPLLNRSGETVETRACTARFFLERLDDAAPLKMIVLPDGIFQMGTLHYLPGSEESPQHMVQVNPFCLASFPVTQGQWRAVMGSLPLCRFHNPDLPIENVRWIDAQEFCRRLARQSGHDYRLPSEAEWEYACRAGTNMPFSTGETITTDLANYVGEHLYAGEQRGVYRHAPTPAGTFPPNPFGLEDMHGNLWEFCADRWHADYSGAPLNSSPWNHSGESGYRAARGGSWHEPPANCRSAVRLRVSEKDHDDYYGFRVAMSIQ